MPNSVFAERIFANLPFSPTADQNALIHLLAEILQNPSQRHIATILGYAGTGKTSVIAAFTKALSEMKISFQLLAPTGRAAKVLSSYSNHKAFTIHKKIYRQKNLSDNFSPFSLNFNPHKNTIFIVDEASMISDIPAEKTRFGTGNLLADLLKYVFSAENCQLILIGDNAQLPPVNQPQSPAFDHSILNYHTGHTCKILSHTMTQVVRQSQESGILFNATTVRDSEKYLPFEQFPQLKTEGFSDISNLCGYEVLEKMTEAYETLPHNDLVVITRTNKRANLYNQAIRSRILYREEQLCPEDLLMVVRNNYSVLPENPEVSFIANGDTLKLVRVRKYTERYGFNFALADLVLPDYENLEFQSYILLDTLLSETPALSQEQNWQLYQAVAEDYEHITDFSTRRKEILKDPFLNALQIKYAYAITCHKAQGGQWHTAFIDHGFIPDDKIDLAFSRWLYTAITRAQKNLFLINFNAKFF